MSGCVIPNTLWPSDAVCHQPHPCYKIENEKSSRASLSRCIARISLVDVIQKGTANVFGMSIQSSGTPADLSGSGLMQTECELACLSTSCTDALNLQDLVHWSNYSADTMRYL